MIVIDVEASGLGPESYPIEIAWGHRFDPTKFDTFLIKPADGWVYWDTYAESAIHCISRSQLQREGISIAEAVERLDDALQGAVVYSDYVPADRPWWVKLYRELGRDLPFEFRPVQTLIPPAKEASYSLRLDASPTEHRALEDVRKIIQTLNFFAPG